MPAATRDAPVIPQEAIDGYQLDDEAVGDCLRRAALTERYRSDHHVYERHSERAAGALGWVVLRADGRSFHTLTARHECERPFDVRFEAAMDAGAQRLMKTFPSARCAYVQSDEITLVLDERFGAFSRRLEKLVSVAASACAVAFSLRFGQPAEFDCRTLECPREEDVLAVLAERQLDAVKNSVSMAAHWALIQERGLTAVQADRVLRRRGGLRDRMALLDELGRPFNDLAAQRRRGRLLRHRTFQRAGVDPRTGAQTVAERRALEWDRDMLDVRYVRDLEHLIAGRPD